MPNDNKHASNPYWDKLISDFNKHLPKKHHGHKKHTPMPTVVLDAGHGYFQAGCHETGATAEDGRVEESKITLQIVERIRQKLRHLGYRVVRTRTEKDENIFSTQGEGLHHRVQVAENEKKHGRDVIFVSVHTDSTWRLWQEGEQIYSDPGDAKSAHLGKLIADEFNNEQTTNQNNLRQDNPASTNNTHDYQVLRETHALGIPAVLIETCNLRKGDDRDRITSVEGQENIADQVVEGIGHFMPPLPRQQHRQHKGHHHGHHNGHHHNGHHGHHKGHHNDHHKGHHNDHHQDHHKAHHHQGHHHDHHDHQHHGLPHHHPKHKNHHLHK